MSQDEFTRLFQYMQKMGTKLDTVIENMATKEEVSQILNRLDSIEKQLEISDDERLVMGRQLGGLNKWTHELANKTGHSLAT